MPFPSKKKPRRRCWRCRHAELAPAETPTGQTKRFKLVPSLRGKGPECPPYTGCFERARQSVLPGLSV